MNENVKFENRVSAIVAEIHESVTKIIYKSGHYVRFNGGGEFQLDLNSYRKLLPLRKRIYWQIDQFRNFGILPTCTYFWSSGEYRVYIDALSTLADFLTANNEGDYTCDLNCYECEYLTPDADSDTYEECSYIHKKHHPFRPYTDKDAIKFKFPFPDGFNEIYTKYDDIRYEPKYHS